MHLWILDTIKLSILVAWVYEDILLCQVDAWAQSNTVPGLFTGSTGAQVLSSEELSTSGPQAWLKKVIPRQTLDTQMNISISLYYLVC